MIPTSQKKSNSLQCTAFYISSIFLGLKRSSGSRFKYISYSLSCFSGTFKVSLRLDPFTILRSFFALNRLLFHFICFFVISQILFVTNKNDWYIFPAPRLLYFRSPFFRNVLQTVRIINGEAHQNNISACIAYESCSGIFLLSFIIP